jgi:hypothetical protein
VKSATVEKPRPASGTSVRSTAMLGPAMAELPLSSGSLVTHGTEVP